MNDIFYKFDTSRNESEAKLQIDETTNAWNKTCVDSGLSSFHANTASTILNLVDKNLELNVFGGKD